MHHHRRAIGPLLILVAYALLSGCGPAASESPKTPASTPAAGDLVDGVLATFEEKIHRRVEPRAARLRL